MLLSAYLEQTHTDLRPETFLKEIWAALVCVVIANGGSGKQFAELQQSDHSLLCNILQHLVSPATIDERKRIPAWFPMQRPINHFQRPQGSSRKENFVFAKLKKYGASSFESIYLRIFFNFMKRKFLCQRNTGSRRLSAYLEQIHTDLRPEIFLKQIWAALVCVVIASGGGAMHFAELQQSDHSLLCNILQRLVSLATVAMRKRMPGWFPIQRPINLYQLPQRNSRKANFGFEKLKKYGASSFESIYLRIYFNFIKRKFL